jgi:biotin carboxylase
VTGQRGAEPVHVFVLDGGAQFSPPIMSALRRRGARVTLAAGAGEACPAVASRFSDAVVRHPPLDDALRFTAFLRELVPRAGIDVVLPLVDEALVAVQPYREELERIVPLAVPPAGCVASALDKAETVARAHEIPGGFLVPPTIAPVTADEASRTWAGRFPVVVKPRTGTGSEGIRLARDREELARVFDLVSRRYPAPLVQERVEYLPGDKHVLLYLFDGRKELRSWYGQRVLLERKSLRVGVGQERARGGVSLLWESHNDEGLLRRGRQLLEGLDWRGLAAIECARDRRDGRHYLFEINARLDGTVTLPLRHGPNFAYDSCLVALGREPPLQLRFQAGRRARKGPFTMLDARELRSALSLLDPRVAPPLPILRDPLPLVREAARLIGKRLPRRGSAPTEPPRHA